MLYKLENIINLKKKSECAEVAFPLFYLCK